MKVWAQKQFPTLLRATVQGAVIFAGRVASALFATVTPTLIAMLGPSTMYGVLAAVSAVGFATAWFVFRSRDQNDVLEDESAAVSASVETVSPRP